MKTCKNCGVSKPINCFGKDSHNKDGLKYDCKDCRNAKAAKYRAENPDNVRDAYTKWQSANPDKLRDKRAKYYAENKNKMCAAISAWKSANKEKMHGYYIKWKSSNPDKLREYYQNSRAKRRAAGGKLSSGLEERLFKLQRGKCACCGKPLGDDYHLDHIMPIAIGGTNTDDNIQLLRAECNHQKHAKHPVDFMRQRGFLL